MLDTPSTSDQRRHPFWPYFLIAGVLGVIAAVRHDIQFHQTQTVGVLLDLTVSFALDGLIVGGLVFGVVWVIRKATGRA